MDETTTIAQLKAAVQAFCEERDWDQFHAPKDLAIGVITEASELLEHFRFKSEAESLALLDAPETRREIEHELADALYFILRFAQRFDIDLGEALSSKLGLNAQRYPVDKARGRNARAEELK